MNVLGVFTFGRLIKTFLPGLILFSSLLIYVEIIGFVLFGKLTLSRLILGDSALFITLLIPSSIIAGIFSNTLFFAYANDFFISGHHRREYPEFYEFEKHITKLIKQQISTDIGVPEYLRPGFERYLDVGHFVLDKTPLDKLIFLQESYWYYMEFQVNGILATIFAAPAIALSWVLFSLQNGLASYLVLLVLVTMMVLSMFLFKVMRDGAMKNYDRHKKNHFSLIMGVFFFENQKLCPNKANAADAPKGARG